MNTWKNIVLTGVFLLFFLFSWFSRFTPVSLDLQAPVSIRTEIKGEIINPGVYTMARGSTLEELVEEAGGITPQGDLSALPLLEILQENQVVVIPEVTEEKRISINTASAEELMELPGVGPAIAQRIISYRNEKSFLTVEELKEVKGIGEKMFERLKERIRL